MQASLCLLSMNLENTRKKFKDFMKAHDEMLNTGKLQLANAVSNQSFNFGTYQSSPMKPFEL